MKLGSTWEKTTSRPLHLIQHFRWQVVIDSQGLNGSVGNIKLVHFFFLMSPSNNKQQTPSFQEKLMFPSSLSASYSTRDHSSPRRCFHCQSNSPSFSFSQEKKQMSLFRQWFPSAARGHSVPFNAVFHVKHWISVSYIPPICHNLPDTAEAPPSKALQIIRACEDTKFSITKLRQGSNSSILSKQCRRNQTPNW